MANNIKLNLPGKPFTTQIVTFTAPCDCANVSDGLSINGEIYTVCDAMGECVTGKGGAWCAGAQISVVLDCENKKAYIQNAAVPDMTIENVTGLQSALDGKAASSHSHTPASIGAAAVSHSHATSDITGLETLLSNYIKIATGSYVGTGTYGADNPSSVTLPFVPRVFHTGIGGGVDDEVDGSVYIEGVEDSVSNWSISGHTISWYTSATVGQAAAQHNRKNSTYYWYALG